MPKLNNKGISFIPVLVLSLLVGVSALVGYKYYSTNSENVLQMSDNLSKEVELRLSYSQLENDNQSGTITLSFKGNEVTLKDLLKRFQTLDLIKSAGDYCMNIECPSNTEKKIKPKVAFTSEKLLNVEIPVSSNMISAISVFPFFRVEGKIKFVNDLKEWDTIKLSDDTAFRLIRKEQKPNISIISKSLNSRTGQQTLEVKISGTGRDFAGLVRGLRILGVTRVDFTNSKESSIVIKPLVSFKKGVAILNINSLGNTKSFIFPNAYRNLDEPTGVSSYDFGNLPNGWEKNKTSNGVDNTNLVKQKITFKVTQSIDKSNLKTLNFQIEGNNTSISNVTTSIKTKGIKLFEKEEKNDVAVKGILKPTVLCSAGEDSVCKFNITISDRLRIRFNYEGLETEYKLIPEGWVIDPDAKGLR